MLKEIQFGDRMIGKKHQTYFIAEVGINHNGDLDIAKKLIDVAVVSGCDAVKFQKRTPELCVPSELRDVKRDTPWGIMSYMDYREKVEFGQTEYEEIERYCKKKKISWFASCWDIPSVEFIEQFDPVCYKIASASLTDFDLLKCINEKKRPVIISTGMSTMEQIRNAISFFDPAGLLIAHTTSAYPCKNEELNLKMIQTLQKEFNNPIGYSGHETGVQTSLAAMVLGACFIERHITLDRAMWGSDQAASLEPPGLMRLVRDIRIIEKAYGSGIKVVYDSEKKMIDRLRRIKT